MTQLKSRQGVLTLIALGAITFSSSFFLSGCGSPKQAAAAPAPTSVDLHTVQQLPYKDGAEFMAQVNSKNATTIHPQVDSRIVRVLVTDGQLVRAGQPLFQLDVSQQAAVVSSLNATRSASMEEPALIQKNIEALRADLSAAQSDLAFNRKQLERYQDLLEKHTVSIRDTEQYQTTVQSQEQKVKSILANIASQQSRRREAIANIGRDTATVQSARANLAYYTVRAPFTGNVGTLAGKVGDVVDTDTILTTLTDNRNLEIEVAVSADYRSKVYLGTPIEVSSMSDEHLGSMKISYIDPKVDPQTQTFLLKALATNTSNQLAMDQHIKARIIWGEKSAIRVPLMAVFRVDGQPFVYRAVHKANRPEDTKAGEGQPTANQADDNALMATMQAVTLGPIVENDVIVSTGLKTGDVIVTKGIQKLQEGVPIAQSAPPASEPEAEAGSKEGETVKTTHIKTLKTKSAE
jgi:multidrug efflux pump subunit AcrA (membrane-fusion protein)